MARSSRVPSGRIERLARIGWMAGEAALGGVAESVRRMGGAPPAAASVLLTGGNAERLARRLSHLRGAAMKLGQLLSMEGDDLLPPEVARAFHKLRADGDSMPASQLHRVLGRNWGRDWRERLASFDDEPLAAASIGQVHAGAARDGRRLVFKIQYPGVARSIESDVDNLATALRLARLLPGELDPAPIVTEAKRQLRQESDYRAEADLLTRYAELLGDDPELRVPRVHPEFTTHRILAMDRLEGSSFEALCDEAPQRLRDHVGRLLYRLLFRELFELRFLQSDPNPANYLWLDESRQLGLLDLGSALEVSETLADRYARLFRAALDRDRETLAEVALEIGLHDADERRDRVEALLDVIEIGCEPFTSQGAYDFGRSDLALRGRQASMALAFEKGFMKPPPAETMFLHRKIGGTFLLCARLRARVDARALLEDALASRGLAGDLSRAGASLSVAAGG